jgi:hypothetical protein
LWVFFITRAAQLVVGSAGVIATVAGIVGNAALCLWAVLEIGWGVNPFRRVLGAVVLVGEIATHLRGN